MNQSSRKCLSYSYRGNEETFLDLSCKKSPLTTTKQLPKWIKWEESGKSLWYFEKINPVSIVIYPLCWGSDTKGLVETRGVSNLLFSPHHYHPLNPLVLLVMRHRITDWYEVRMWFEYHQTITKNNRITLTKYISK